MVLSRCPLIGEAGSDPRQWEEEEEEDGQNDRAPWTRDCVRDYGNITTDNLRIVFEEGALASSDPRQWEEKEDGPIYADEFPNSHGRKAAPAPTRQPLEQGKLPEGRPKEVRRPTEVRFIDPETMWEDTKKWVDLLKDGGGRVPGGGILPALSKQQLLEALGIDEKMLNAWYTGWPLWPSAIAVPNNPPLSREEAAVRHLRMTTRLYQQIKIMMKNEKEQHATAAARPLETQGIKPASSQDVEALTSSALPAQVFLAPTASMSDVGGVSLGALAAEAGHHAVTSNSAPTNFGQLVREPAAKVLSELVAEAAEFASTSPADGEILRKRLHDKCREVRVCLVYA